MNFKKYCVTLVNGPAGSRDVDVFARDLKELNDLISKLLWPNEEVFNVGMYVGNDVLEFVANYL